MSPSCTPPSATFTTVLAATSPSMSSTMLCWSMPATSRVAVTTVAHDRHAGAQIHHLADPMRDEDDATPVGDQLADGCEHALDLSFTERRRRLVEDQDACVSAQRSRISTNWRSAMERSSTLVSGRTSRSPEPRQ